MTIVFRQIRDEMDIAEKESFGTILLSSIIILSIGLFFLIELHANPFITTIIMIFFAWFGRPIFRKFYGDFAKKTDFIGKVTFDENSICYLKDKKERKVNFNEINSINFNYNYVQGKQFAYKDIYHNGLTHLLITTNSKQEISIKFLIEKEQQLKNLKPIWTNLYKQGIKIKESMGKYNVKTILFDSSDSFSYEKIQELKKDLNIDTII